MPDAQKIRQFFAELRRRKVIRVAIVYAVIAWAAIQVAQVTFEPLNLPRWTVTLVIMLALLGFPVSIALARAFDATPAGIRREEPVDGMSAAPAPKPLTSGTPYIAVLPFDDMSPDDDRDQFCEGMADETLNALMPIERLRVAARTSAFQLKGRARACLQSSRTNRPCFATWRASSRPLETLTGRWACLSAQCSRAWRTVSSSNTTPIWTRFANCRDSRNSSGP